MLAVEKHTGTMDPGGSSSDNSAVEDGRAIMIDVYAAVQNNDEVAIKQYAESGGDLEARDKDALTPLHVAAAGGYSNVVEFLTKKGCR